MRILFTAACLAWTIFFPEFCSATVPCRIVVQRVAYVSGPWFSLRDLLLPEDCPEFASAGAQLAMGRAPLEGSTRVLDGNDLRARIEDLARHDQRLIGVSLLFDIPERISVRRAGARSSCAEIVARILGEAPEKHLSPSRETDCGAAGRVRQDAAFRITHKKWDPALRSWIFSVGCAEPADCVPFVLRAPPTESGDRISSVAPEAPDTPITRPPLAPVVRAGQAASLLWEQAGIRMVLPVVCMEPGAAGDRVRVRTANGRRMFRAIVVRAGILRAIS